MRLAGRTKLGYYPLPPTLAAPLARLLQTAEWATHFRMLDPCCGDGTALNLLREEIAHQHAAAHGRWAEFGATTWGIELDQVRAKQASMCLDHVLATSFFSTTLSTGNGADRGWQMAYINPIYDDGSEEVEGGRARQEVQFLKRGTERLCDWGIMLWVIPQHVLARRGVATYLAEHYDRHHCFRFPDATWRPPGSAKDVGMYEQFRQIIWIGRKLPQLGPADQALAAQIERWAHMGEALAPLPLEGCPILDPYRIPNAPGAGPVKYFLAGSFDPDAVAERLGQFAPAGRPMTGVWATEEFWQARFPPPGHGLQNAVGHGLHAFTRGYVISFAVAGLVNRAILCGKTSGRRLLVKGHTHKMSAHTEQDDGREVIEKETDRFESSLWALDLDSMQLMLVELGQQSDPIRWGVEYTRMPIQEFLAEFGESLMDQVQQLNAPRYQEPHQVPWAKRAFAYLKRRPLGRQLDAILAQVHALVNATHFPDASGEDLRLSHLAEVAEMGAGKTYMAMATAFLADLYACGCAEEAPPGTRLLSLFPMLILSPAIMAPKWKRELEQTLPDARVLIVEKFGPRRGRDEDDEDERDLRAGNATSERESGRSAFRQFDPHFAGEALGLVGSVDQAVAVIRRDLEHWRTQYARVVEHNRAAQSTGAPESALAPVPLKPTHVLILTFHTARTMPAWMPVWRMKPARIIDRESRHVKLLRRRGERPEDQAPLFYPACPSCLRLVKDEQQIGKFLAISAGSEKEEERAFTGRELGLHLLAAEERLRHALLSCEAYAALAREQARLLDGEPPADAVWTRLEAARLAHLESLPTFQRMQTEQRRAEEAENGSLVQEWTRHLAHFVMELPCHDGTYRDLLCQQDQRFREVQQTLAQRLKEVEAKLSASDAAYQRLLAEKEAAAANWRRHAFRRAAYEAEASEPTGLYLTEAVLRGKKDYRVQHRCTECGEPLWQYVAKQPKDYHPYSVQDALPARRREAHASQWVSSRQIEPLPLPGGTQPGVLLTATWRRSYALARYLSRHYSGVFKLLVSDEVHEGADGTALDQARQVLARTCGHMIGLTGTLSNGYASSLFRLYYTLMPSVRAEFAYDDTRRWIRLHGKMQTTRKTRYEEPPAGTGSDSVRQISPGMPITREIPGFDATGMGRVARVSSFTGLTDVVTNLVKYEEHIRFVSMGEELGTAYSVFQGEITRKMRDLLREGDNSGLSPWYHALLTVGDMPWQEYVCQTKQGVLLGKFAKLPESSIWPIETALLNYVQEQHTAGHRVLVYTEHTGQYDEQLRIKALLERYVRGRGGRRLDVRTLRTNSTRRSMDREAWLARAVEEGVDVLICNPALVKVGLDLIAFPKIVYKSFPDKVTDFRQSSRRSWRPGQTENVEVVILTYHEAMSARLLQLMARKTLASFKVEGKIGGEGLVSHGEEEEAAEGDLSSQLAREMLAAYEAGTLSEVGDLAREIQSLALDAARIEQEQQQRLGEESDQAAIFLKEIQTVPLVLPSPLDIEPGEAAAAPLSPSVPEDWRISTPSPHLEPASMDACVPETRMSASQPEGTQVGTATIVPLPITTPNPILAEAGVDAWAELRQLFGVGSRRRKGGSTRKR